MKSLYLTQVSKLIIGSLVIFFLFQKFLKVVVVKQLGDHLQRDGLVEDLEFITALVKGTDPPVASDSGINSVLVLIHLSATLNTTDHNIFTTEIRIIGAKI